MATSSKKRKPRRTEKQARKQYGDDYVDDINAIVDDIFERAYRQKFTFVKLAEHSGVSYGTIQRLADRLTWCPHYRTVAALARAVGGRVRYVEGPRVRLKLTWDTDPKPFRVRRAEKKLAA